jgi:hypothetical protein
MDRFDAQNCRCPCKISNPPEAFWWKNIKKALKTIYCKFGTWLASKQA